MVAAVRRFVIEVSIAGTAYLLYRHGRTLTRGHAAAAVANAGRVVHWERMSGMFTEDDVQRWVLDRHLLIQALNRYYVSVHFPATITLLVWVFVRHRHAYARVRNWFALVTFVALVIHIAFPLAPPRMAAGLDDTLREFGPRIYPQNPSESMANQFAAMPSLHFGWALMSSATIVFLRRTRLSLLAFGHVTVTLLAIVATGNHYWFDAGVAGLIAVTVGAMVWLPPLRRRPHEVPATAV